MSNIARVAHKQPESKLTITCRRASTLAIGGSLSSSQAPPSSRELRQEIKDRQSADGVEFRQPWLI